MERVSVRAIWVARVLGAMVFTLNGTGVIDQTIPANEMMERGGVARFRIRQGVRALYLTLGCGVARILGRGGPCSQKGENREDCNWFCAELHNRRGLPIFRYSRSQSTGGPWSANRTCHDAGIRFHGQSVDPKRSGSDDQTLVRRTHRPSAKYG
jgi:hypothetical protein